MITASGMVKPIRKLIENMKEIRNGDDLSSRIDVGNGSDEVYELADNYNEMLDRLEYSFEKEKQFTSDASHELRTPVSVINAQLDLLDDKSTIEEYREAEAVIRRQSRRMTTLIEDMLCFSRLDNGSDMYPKYKFDFSALCKSIAEDMKLIGFKRINLEFEIEDKISICGSEKLLTRMVQNLIDNAYKYGKENGNIKVTLIKEKDNICVLNVSDDGLGIKEEDKEHIFDRFYRADKSRSNRNKTSGNGLGLSMVKKIAQYHDGSVTVDSEYGKGSNFKVSLICL